MSLLFRFPACSAIPSNIKEQNVPIIAVIHLITSQMLKILSQEKRVQSPKSHLHIILAKRKQHLLSSLSLKEFPLFHEIS